MRIVFILLSLFFIFTATCNADEIIGSVREVSAVENTINISGVVVLVQKARIENEFDQLINLSGIAAGDYVSVEGAFAGHAQMRAMKIERRYPEQDKIKGRIESVNAAARELVIGGITIDVPENAWLVDAVGSGIRMDKIKPNYYAECTGTWAGEASFTANRINLN